MIPLASTKFLKRKNEISKIIEETNRCLHIQCNTNDLSLSEIKKDLYRNKTNMNIPSLCNEMDDEQLESFQNESNNIIPWWEDNQQDDEFNADQVLTTSDETLQKIVHGALQLMSNDSTKKVQKRIKTYVDRKRLRKQPRHTRSKNTYIQSQSLPSNNMETSISSANVGHQLLQKIGWTPGNGLGLNQNGIKSPISINFHQRRQGLGYEKELTTTNESLSIQSSPINIF